MNIITLDFETFYSDEYTLSKMTTEAYVRDPRFEVHGCAFKINDAIWWNYEHPDGVEATLRKIDWDNIACLCHHAQFDGLILSHHYGIKPKMFLDTLSMARLLIGAHLSVSLKSLADHFDLQTKTIPYDLFKGKHWHELSSTVQQQVAQGACDDTSITWDLFCQLAKSFPPEEYKLVDATVRMFTNPVLEGDTNLLAQIWQEEEAAKRALLDELEITAVDLRQQWKFAELLRAQGVEPEQKPGKPAKCDACDGTGNHPTDDGMAYACVECDGKGTTDRWLYSFAKTDDFMRDLLDHEDDTIRLLAEAKLAAHSNGVQTRTARLGWMSTRGALPVYLNYAGTHLAGWSGGDKVNWQNFKRGGPIAKAIRAPKGYLVISVDASQIECRLLNQIAGQEDKVEDFRQHKDPYASVASAFYGFPIDKENHPIEREGGKRVELMSGYGAGGPKIARTLRTFKLKCTDEEGTGWRDAYRITHPFVTNLWEQGGDVLKKLNAGMEFDWNVVHIHNKIMYLPGGVPLRYDTLEWHQEENGDKGWRMRTRRNGWNHIWGGMLVQQLMQALRRTFICEAWQRMMIAGLDMVTMEHDKLVSVVREHEAEAAFAYMKQEMSRPPLWLPDVPLDSEGYISETFAKLDK